MMNLNNELNILYLNIFGQTKLPLEKQSQISDLIKFYHCDIVHLQEIDIEETTFQTCPFITNNYTIISNNSLTKYGVASLVKNDWNVTNVSFDTEGRLIIFEIESVTFGNVYFPAGTDSNA